MEEPKELTMESPEVVEYLEKQAKPSPTRSFTFDRKGNLQQYLKKGLRKPGKVSADTLRRAAKSVHVVRICINVLKEKVTKTAWVIKPIDSTNADANDPRIKELTDFFKHPNSNSETYRTLLDKMLEDLYVLDMVSLEKTRFPDGRLAELHYVDSATIRPVYDMHGQQDILIPIRNTENKTIELPVSYLQVLDNSQYGGPDSGDIVAAWPKMDFINFMMHPQGQMDSYGYGLSPIESVMSVVANILNADNFNGTYFDEGSFPPMILQLIGQVDQRDLEAYREYFYQEMQGNFHRPAIFAGAQEAKVINLKDITQRDMQFMEYMKFLARLMAAAYGLAAQDIGLTEDLNRSLAETQKSLSEAKGYASTLHLLKEVFNQEIIWKDFGYDDLEFDWVAEDSTDPLDASVMYDRGLRNGIYTINEVRRKLGEEPFEEWADTPAVLGADSVYRPIVVPETAESKADHQESTVGNETIYEDQASSDIKKSIYTEDGYKCYADDRGYGQPFICYNVLNGEGYVVKPPVAVNVTSQDLEIEISAELRNRGLNVPTVEKMAEVDIVANIIATPEVLLQFRAYQDMTTEYDSEKWRAKFGGSRKFPFYIVQQFIEGRNLRDPLLLEDMRRDPKSYVRAIKDLAALWRVEKEMVLGDRRPDQYIVTPKKRAYGIDYQFRGEQKRWEDNKNAIPNLLNQVPMLRQVFMDETAEPSLKSAIRKLKKMVFRKTTFGLPTETQATFEEVPVMFGQLVQDVGFKLMIKNLFAKTSVALLLDYGFKEKSFVYSFNQAIQILRECVEKYPEAYGGVVTQKDGADPNTVKYFVYVKENQ